MTQRFVQYLPLLALLFFLPFLGSIHLFDWDEINFAESSREMLVSGNYGRVQINFLPFWEKPPLFFWLQALCMHIFGIGEFAARLPNALVGILTLFTLFRIGEYLAGKAFAHTWALLLFGSFLPHLYFKSGIIDPLFNYFIFLSVFFLTQTRAQVKRKKALHFAAWAGLCSGLAVLTKGPVSLLLVGLTFGAMSVGHFVEKFNNKNTISTPKNVPTIPPNHHINAIIAVYMTTTLIVCTLWLGYETAHNGWWFIETFIRYQIRLFSTPDAGHAQPFYYHFVVILLGCFPLSIWGAAALAQKIQLLLPYNKQYSNNPNDNSHVNTADIGTDVSVGTNTNANAEKLTNNAMHCLFWAVLLVFSIAQTKIIHYSSAAYLPLSYLAAKWVYAKSIHYDKNEHFIPNIVKWLYCFVGTIWAIVLLLLPLLAMNPHYLLPFMKDPFAKACLQIPIHWNGYEWLPAIFFIFMFGLSIWQIKRHQVAQATRQMNWAIALTLLVWMPSVLPKIEAFSQKPLIDFCQSLAGKDVHVMSLGFKSYAPLFYAQVSPQNQQPQSREQALSDTLKKDIYFITKTNKHKGLDTLPTIQHLHSEGGYTFWLKKAKP